MFGDRGIHLDVFALNTELRDLAKRLRHIPYGTAVLMEERPNRHHSCLENRFLEFEMKGVSEAERIANRSHTDFALGFQHLRHTPARNCDFTGQVEQTIQFIEIDAQSSCGFFMRIAGGSM